MMVEVSSYSLSNSVQEFCKIIINIQFKHLSVLIWREVGRPGIWSQSIFLGQMPCPSDIIFGQKRTNSQPLKLRVEVKCVLLKVETYQHF